MKQHLQRLGKFFFLSALMLLMSCQNDEPASTVHQHEASTGRITLKQFKEETKISDFSSVFRTASIAGIECKGTESIDDFVIDTLAVEKYNSDHSGVSYSFFVYPINREEVGLNEIFNLVYYKDGNKWETSIFSLEKISTPGNPDSYENIQMLYGRLQNNAGICWSMNYSFHCTGTGPCAGGRCDMCSLCVSTSSTANVCSSGTGSSQLPTDSVSPDFGVSTGGGGGVSYAQFMNALRLDADHLAWIENYQNSFFKARLLEMGIGLPSIAAVAEIREEFRNKVDFLIRHPQMCQDIMIYVIANHYFVSAQIFAWEAVSIFIDGGEVDFAKGIIYTINKPCQKEVVKNMMAVSSPLTNLIKDTFNTSDNVNLKFWNGDISAQAPNANAYVNPTFTGTPDNFIIKIGLDDDFLSRGTDLAIVAVTLHEVVHAYFYSLYIQNKLVATNSNYNTLQNAFIAYYANASPQTYNPLDNELHNVMNNFMGKIANAIYNYAQSNHINGVTPAYCLSLAWGTMEGTDLFNQMLNPDQRAEANHAFMTEQNNTQYDTTFPIKGTPCP